MHFIKLRQCDNHKKFYYINVDNIDGVTEWDGDGGGSVIFAGGESPVVFAESPEQVFELIKEVLDETIFIHEGFTTNRKTIRKL